ncbi:nucleotidyltransferase domain-containing protein [Candidatus Saganbacteria bacterium]|nr:nucleotidyltransferase domain-containing protein [Candidatus Saganbacteria bacterium]
MSKEIKDKFIKEFLTKYRNIIKSIYNPYGVWLFGSRVSGIPKEESDIDMIVVSEKFRGIKFIYRMGEVLKNIDFSKHIDAICYTPDEFEKKKNEIGMVKEAIEKGSKII